MTISGDYYRTLVSGARSGTWATLLRGGLWSVSRAYGLATRLRNRLYDTGWKPVHRAEVPVVSIGNLTLGGTGKTPCVEYVARYYQACRRRVVILSRGYGSKRGRNDEALLLDQNLPGVPHLQGRDRVALAKAAVRQHQADLLVLDDGLQHRRLARDLDVVLVDATQPWGHGHLFPRGLLREAPDGLGRAGFVLLTRVDLVADDERQKLRQAVARFAPGVPVAETVHRPLELVNAAGVTATLDSLDARPVAAFCGIGNPDAFRHSLLDRGISVVAFRSYPDHHLYSPDDRADLCRWLERQPADCLALTTQKDLVKLAPSFVSPSKGGRKGGLAGRELWALRIGLHFKSGQEHFHTALESVCSVSGER